MVLQILLQLLMQNLVLEKHVSLMVQLTLYYGLLISLLQVQQRVLAHQVLVLVLQVQVQVQVQGARMRAPCASGRPHMLCNRRHG